MIVMVFYRNSLVILCLIRVYYKLLHKWGRRREYQLAYETRPYVWVSKWESIKESYTNLGLYHFFFLCGIVMIIWAIIFGHGSLGCGGHAAAVMLGSC